MGGFLTGLFGGGGPSQGEQTLAARMQSFTNQTMGDYSQLFANQAAVMSDLRAAYTPIFQAGPDQQGFGPNELAALNTQATEGVGTNYAKARTALETGLSARGGGNEFLPTGGRAELEGSLAQAAAAQQSNAELAITRANYETGRENWQRAGAGLNALASEYNPTAAGSLAATVGKEAFSQAGEVNQEKIAAQNAKISGITGGIEALATGGLGLANDFAGGFAGGNIFGSGGLLGGL